MNPLTRPLALATAIGALIIGFVPRAAEAQRPSDSERSGPARFDRTYGREHKDHKIAFHPVVADAARATHRVLSNSRHCALATAVHTDGWLVTKASELDPKESLEIEFPGGLRLPATVSDRLDAYDLALLKVDAAGLKVVSWSDRPVPTPGSFLAAAGPAEGVAAIGIASVGLRNLYESPKGYMGVQLLRASTGPAVIDEVMEGGAAEEAGLQKNDQIVAVDGVTIQGREALVNEISRRRPGEEITLKVLRGEDEIEIRLSLMDRRESMARHFQDRDPMVLMSGRLSRHRRSFINVFQHDLVLAPEECGGPLVDLDGHVVGLDIARSGRVESLAIPAADLKNLLAQVTTGKFALPDLDALRDELKKAELAIRLAQDARDQAGRTLDRARALHATLPTPAPPAIAATEDPPTPAAPTNDPPAPTPAMPVQAAEAPAGMP